MNIKTQNVKIRDLSKENTSMLLFWIFFYAVLIVSIGIFFTGYVYSMGVNFLFYLFIVLFITLLISISHPKLRIFILRNNSETFTRYTTPLLSCSICP
jgi:hypothetical protein